MKKQTFALVILALFCLSVTLPATTFAENTQSSKSDDEKPVGSKSGEKGGIYVVGRGFKTAGHEMGEGFKAAGKGIKKGGKATGRAFKKAGGSVKDFFTGEKSDEEKEPEKK